MLFGPHIGVALAVALFAPDKLESGDTAKIQGRWTVIFLGEAGVCLPPYVATQIKMEFRETKVSVSSPMWGETKGTFHLDESKTPKAIDIVWGEEKRLVRSIYELDGNKLKICTGVRSDERPTKFATDSASGTGITALSRKAP